MLLFIAFVDTFFKVAYSECNMKRRQDRDIADFFTKKKATTPSLTPSGDQLECEGTGRAEGSQAHWQAAESEQGLG